uniref:Uncharacterized protein n=1 Tax=uncultured bacterium Rifle_16ft_4_minimus_37862 TaxID=1665157 RepID=A0A0H4TQI6_9BACT|nr:hypothetical protein [uncultured bacterium Rifle_16ft_4_minimus_37862]
MSTSLNLPDERRFDMKSETAVVENAAPPMRRTEFRSSSRVIQRSRGMTSAKASARRIGLDWSRVSFSMTSTRFRSSAA